MILPDYHLTQFMAKKPVPSEWPETFAVITACNPYGKGLDDQADKAATGRLRKSISRRGLKRHRVTGVSADAKHREPGFAVWGCDLRTALAIGREFSQNAIFWVENGRIDVVSCTTDQREVVGLWSGRLVPGGIPDECCRVYVVELDGEVRSVKKVREANPQADPRMKCLYVGSSARTPEQRFKVHKEGGKQSSSIVRKFGRRLVPAHYRHLSSMTRPAAERSEQLLAQELRARGYTVWQK